MGILRDSVIASARGPRGVSYLRMNASAHRVARTGAVMCCNVLYW